LCIAAAVLTVLSVVYATSSRPDTTEGPQSNVQRIEQEFEPCVSGTVVVHHFTLRNESEQPVAIGRISTACACISATCDLEAIPANGTATVVVSLDTSGLAGPQVRPATVRSDDGRYELVVRGLVAPRLRVEPAEQIVNVGTAVGSAVVGGVARVRVTALASSGINVISAPDELDVTSVGSTEENGARTEEFEVHVSKPEISGAYAIVFGSKTGNDLEVASAVIIVSPDRWVSASPSVLIVPRDAESVRSTLRLLRADGSILPVASYTADTPGLIDESRIVSGALELTIGRRAEFSPGSHSPTLSLVGTNGESYDVPVMYAHDDH